MVTAGLGFSTSSAQASSCTQYHYVKAGQNLYRIGLIYGLTWDKLVDMNDIENPSKIYAGQKICVSVSDDTSTPPSTNTVPTFSISSVVADDSVTIKAKNFPKNENFKVRMGKMWTRGVDGIKVDTVNSGDGSFTATFDIPSSLKGEYRIAIRLESSSSGHYSYNWFYNNTTGSSTTTDPGYSGFPYFFIQSVVRNGTVTIKGYNFPADTTFKVRMGKMWTRGMDGIKVDTYESGDGGTFTATFDIPDSLAGEYRIAIRLENSSSGYYAYNWFYNNTTY